MLTLRPYQETAKTAVYDHLRTRDDNPCVVIPTAGGKTPLMASICKDAVGLWDTYTDKITVRNVAGETYDTVVGCKLGPIPELVLAGESGNYDEAEIPF